MKKTKKAIITGAVVLGMAGSFATGVLAAEYNPWGGSDAYRSTLESLTQIVSSGEKNKKEKDTALQQVRDKDNVIKDKENIIKDKENVIKSKDQEIADLKKNDKGKELEQAVIDVKDLDQKAKEALNRIK